MIIQKVGLKNHQYEANQVFGQSLTSSPQVSNKKIGMNDFVFYQPMPIKCAVTFGQKKPIIEKAKDFNDSLDKYYRLTPDPYQVRAAEVLYKGDDAVVVAPTGTGKTMIGEYIISKNLAEGKKTFYTTPLKALSNEKMKDFTQLYEAYDALSKRWGNERVGLLTGDTQINPNAPIQVMTTEIYRNKVVGDDKSSLENLGTVIHDEFHTMNDPERGEVWETSVMYTPHKVQQLVLSGTVNNGETVTNWFNRLKTEKAAEAGEVPSTKAELVYMSSEERHVPLKYFIYDESSKQIIPLMVEKYNVNKLAESAKEGAEKPLFEKQKEVLREISKQAGGEGSVDHGIQVLKEVATKPLDNLESLEDDLNQKLGIDQLEAKRMAAHLSDRDERRYNREGLGHFDKKDAKPQRVVSRKLMTDLHESGTMRADSQELLKQLSKHFKGDGSVADGIKRFGAVINNQDVDSKVAKDKLLAKKVDKDLAAKLAYGLALKTQKPGGDSPEIGAIHILNSQDKLPAIFFKFSKKGCDELRDECIKKGVSLLNDEQKQAVSSIVDEYEKADIFLGTGVNKSDFLSGTAVHHAGKMPANKEVVETLAQNKLSKVVFATSTLGAGINVPVRTVFLTQLQIKGGDLSSNELHQMAGRAGRRGKDPIGYVILKQDKLHSPKDIYNMVIAPPDNLVSNFKPQYSFISGFITDNKKANTIGEAVDRSFLKDELESRGLNPEKTLNNMKKQFDQMTKLLTSKEADCFEGKEGELQPTLKGSVVSRARGVDGLLFANTLFNADLDKIAPEELAAVACYLTEGDEKNQELGAHLPEGAASSIKKVEEIKGGVEQLEKKHGIKLERPLPNVYASQFIHEWAKVPEEEAIDGWQNIVVKSSNEHFDEGDLFKSVNRTLDVLEQMKETSNSVAKNAIKRGESIDFAKKMKKIAMNADVAIARMSKNPIAEFHDPIPLEHLKIKL
jgi:superfamily II RNA helicase